MIALAAVLALAAHVVTVQADDLPRKPVYVRVGVGVESRLLLPDALVRVTGPRAAGTRLGLRLGQARPQTLLLFKPREAGTATLTYVGTRHTMRLAVEASVLGRAIDAELRVADKAPDQGGNAAAQPPGKSALALDAPSSQASKNLSLASAPQTPGSSPPADDSDRSGSGAALTTGSSSLASDPGAGRAQASKNLSLATNPPGAAQTPEPWALALTPPGPALDGGTPPPPPRLAVTLRPRHRIGRPGQRGVVIEELHDEPGRRLLYLRIEGAARAQAATVELRGVAVPVTTHAAGRDLVLIATLPVQPLVRPDATLVLHLGSVWTRTPLPLDALDRERAMPGGSS